MRRLGCLFLIVVLTAGLVARAAGPAGATRGSLSTRGHPAAAPAYPTSMAALGDSITQAYDSLGRRQILTAEPQYSWATGYASSIVDSQYLHLLAVDPAIKGNEYNDSVVRARVGGLLAQVNLAIGQNAQYLVILIGADNVCTETVAGMTPVSTFAEIFRTDLATLMKDLPDAHVFVSSIPNLFQLWSVLHDNPSAEGIWSFGICQSMFAKTNTPADRALVLQREEADNSALATACKRYARCRWDNLAVFNAKFTPNEINNFDYFHPSLVGQSRLASITWAASWWPYAK